MTGTYQVKMVKQLKAGDGEKGPYSVQKVRLVTPDTDTGITDVELFCNKWNPVPAPDDSIEGDIGEPFKPGGLPVFKRARRGGGMSFTGPRPEDPKRMASIAMQHSQDAAWRLITFALENGFMKPPADQVTYSWLWTQFSSESHRIFQMVKDAQDAV